MGCGLGCCLAVSDRTGSVKEYGMKLGARNVEPLAPPIGVLVAQRTGLELRAQELERLAGYVEARRRALALPDAAAYGALLAADTPEAAREWRVLIPAITITESYFFRDRGQFALLRRHILPDIIARARARRRLRVWSAGCAGGEEPYSLAILLSGISTLSNDDWEARILGTDINEEALAHARRGVYSAWSLRELSPEERQRYFVRRTDSWELKEAIRRRVEFRFHNLVTDAPPPEAGQGFDLIVCRNVLIYFSRTAAAQAAAGLARALAPGGYLVTGHGELQGLETAVLRAQSFPEAVVYRRPLEGEAVTAPAVSAPTRAAESVTLPRPPVTAPARTAPRPDAFEDQMRMAGEQMRRHAYDGAVVHARAALELRPSHYEAHYLLASACANLGRHAEATASARAATEADHTAAAPHYLLAQIAEEKGRYAEARNEYRKALYLDPQHVAAYLQLAALHEQQGELAQARALRAAALDLLRRLPGERAVAPYEGITPGELTVHVARLLERTRAS